MGDHNPEFRLRIADNRMAVFLDCAIPSGDLDPLLTHIEVELVSLDVAEMPTRQDLEEKLRAAAKNGSKLENEIIVEGRKPIPPQGGQIQWEKEFFASGFVVDEDTDSVDYRKRAENLTVQEGDLLATVEPPTKGIDGCDAFGKRIPAPKPRRARIHAGLGIRREEEEGVIRFYADKAGRIRWASNLLSVDDMLNIKGDVGIETGHIEHPGAVVISGDVLAGSEVSAEGDIEVKGVIESAEIRAGGSLYVRGGITGSKGKKIKVNGSVSAKFIADAYVEAGDNISVGTEVIQSTLKMRGSLAISKGRLIGGSVVALGGIVVGQAGSDGHVATKMLAGDDYSVEDALVERKAKITPLRENLEKIQNTVTPLMERVKTLKPKQREAATELLAKAAEMELAIEEIESEIQEIKEVSRERARPVVVILRKVYPETTVSIKSWTLTVTDERNGPLRTKPVGEKLMLVPTEEV